MKDLSNSIAELVDSINHGATAVGASFRNISPEVWRAAVYQARITAWIYMGIWLFVAGIVAYIADKMRAFRRKAIADGDTRGEADSFETASWVLACVALLITIIAIGEGIIGIMNPEYTAATNIFKILTKGHD